MSKNIDDNIRSSTISSNIDGSRNGNGVHSLEYYKTKEYKICDVLGGLDVTRFVSTNARNFFKYAIDDVELMREYLSEAANARSFSGVENNATLSTRDYSFISIEEMSQTLDWQARGLPEGTTTVEAGIGYTDDRPNRRVDRYVGTFREPLVGDAETDFRMMDSLSPLLPWIVDRKSKESAWWRDHLNGETEGDSKEPFLFESLYTAAWLVSWAEVVMYYPPLAVYGHPLTMGDVVGGKYNSHGDAFIKPNLPQNNPERKATFTTPYPDTALEGVALITATAPVYYTGTFRGYEYNDTFVASLGVDMKVTAVSALLHVLEDSLSPTSFGLLVDSSFNTIVISQKVVQRIYPERTGMEESRVVYDLVDGSIVSDRRNQTYLPSDTILQDLTKLDNADWSGLRTTIQQSIPGERDFLIMNITLTGDTNPTEFYCMYEHWEYVTDWTVLVFAPTAEVRNAMNVSCANTGNHRGTNDTTVRLEGAQGSVLRGSSALVNKGSLDAKLVLSDLPGWIQLESDFFATKDATYTLKSGETLPISFQVATEDLAPGTQSDSIVFEVQDDDYPDCFFREPLSIPFSVKVLPKQCDNNRVPDSDGNCICSSGSVSVGDGCLALSGFVAAIVLPVLALVTLLMYLFILRKRRVAAAEWEIEPAELEFSDPPVTIGRGSFGKVLLAEFRGTKVAVKTILRTHKMARGATSATEHAMEQGVGSIGKIETGNSIKGSISAFSHLAFKGGIFPFNFLGWRSRDSQLNAKEKEQRHNFIMEMRLLSKLRHPNITMIMGGVIKKTQEPMLVLEYMERGSLYDLVRSDTKLDGELLKSILQDITTGVRFLHNAKPQVIHGDLKTQNILIDNKLRAKVTDFGLTASTPYWMSPELLMESSEKTSASDVYALGILLYEIYARETPYKDENVFDVLRDVIDPMVNKRPPRPPGMTSIVAAMMHDCLLPLPEERPSLAELSSRINRFRPKDVDYEMGFDQNRFPTQVAPSLVHGEVVKPVTHDCVTVLYCNIVDFATFSTDMAPMKVADMLRRLFDAFDALAENHQVFKADIIGGGAWMGATNCSHDQSGDHARRMVYFALEALKIIRITRETLVAEGNAEADFVEIQLAIHSGLVDANIVGSDTPKYFLLGETVNMVTELAKKAEPGRVFCSDASNALIASQAPEISTSHQGELFLEESDPIKVYVVNDAAQNAEQKDELEVPMDHTV